MPDYEIRFYRADDTLSLIMKTFAESALEAQERASAMLEGELVRAEIWSNNQRVNSAGVTSITSVIRGTSATRLSQDGADCNG